jgi:non-ribosomal peptide synthetase-like protein
MEKSIEHFTTDAPASPIVQDVCTSSTSDIERNFAEVLAAVVRIEQVSIDSHFFNDLGANSLVMARFCAQVRKRADLPSVSIKDVYRYPTIRSLVAALGDASPIPIESTALVSTETVTATSTLQYVFCGVLQFLIYLAYACLNGLIIDYGYAWVSAGSSWIDIYLRSVLFGGIFFVVLCIFPIAAKWLLIGRWKASEFPVWGLTYVRFWVVKALIHTNPMILFTGTPLYVLYLRALGARIGKGVTILSHTIPVCTDLLTIGADTVIRKDATFLCYRTHAGRIQTGPVTLGRNVYIGEKTVLDINTSMGEDAQLGHASSLQSGQAVPDGQHWHGSPAQQTHLDYVRVTPADCGTLRRFSFGLCTLLAAFFVYIPLPVGGLYMLFTLVPALAKLLETGPGEIISLEFCIDALIFSLVLFLGLVIAGLAFVCTVPRLLNRAIKPDKVYPLYGFHYGLFQAISVMTNINFFKWLFGDSSYIVHYLRCLGYDLALIEQTGANFGTVMKHDTPYLISIGRGTMVCDALSIINADFSSTSFRVSRVSIGAHNFLGNDLAFPAGARTGDNCLLATKVMVPLDGEIREGVGLLGSPCFEIPRSVERDSQFDHLRTGDELRKRLAAKNRYNIRTMCLFLFIRWLHTLVLTALGLASVNLSDTGGPVMVAADLTFSLVFGALYFVLVERIITGFRPLQPQFCSIYDPYYWWHERLWKVPDPYLSAFNGTPFKNVIWRLLGVQLGRRVFDDGASFTERTLTVIGNDCTLNAGSHIQCHSLEDGTFKSDHTIIGAGCTLGVGAFVHYGATMGNGAVLAADSFLMKGEEIPPHAWWGGNPARALTGYQVGSVANPVLVQSVTRHALSQGHAHHGEHAHLAEQNTANAYNNGSTCRSGQPQDAPEQMQSGGKTR